MVSSYGYTIYNVLVLSFTPYLITRNISTKRAPFVITISWTLSANRIPKNLDVSLYALKYTTWKNKMIEAPINLSPLISGNSDGPTTKIVSRFFFGLKTFSMLVTVEKPLNGSMEIPTKVNVNAVTTLEKGIWCQCSSLDLKGTLTQHW